jgi:hypothetical protein
VSKMDSLRMELVKLTLLADDFSQGGGILY